MTTNLQIPPDRSLPPGRLDARRNHLLAEIRVGARRPRLRVWRPRLVAAGVAASVVVVVAAVALHELGGDGGENGTVRVVVAPSGPSRAWNGVVLTGPCVDLSLLDDTCATPRAPRTFSIDVPRALRGGAEDGVEIIGGTPAERRLLRRIVDRLPGSSLTRAEIVPVSDERVTLRFSTAGSDALLNDWEEMLAAGAYRDLARGEGLRQVVGFPPPSPVNAPAAGAGTQVRARLRLAAAAAGATIDQLAIGEPDGLAVLVVVRVSDPGKFLKGGLPRVIDALGDRWRAYDGTFVEVVEEDGAFVWAAGTVPRTSHGSVATRAGLEGCSPVANWGQTAPPCPA